MRGEIETLMPKDIPEAVLLEKEAFGENGWTDRDFEETLNLDYALYLISRREGRINGMAGARIIGGDAYISNVSVKSTDRRTGTATALMNKLMELAARKGAEAFTLEVRSKNTAAVRLYEKLGFVTEGVRKDFYISPTDDALIMWKRDTAGMPEPTAER